MKRKHLYIFWRLLFVAVVLILAVAYTVWQYNLCMDLIGNPWYCLQHIAH